MISDTLAEEEKINGVGTPGGQNMIRGATTTNYFNSKPEQAQNPYIGFVSFQHFRNEALYSDVVVSPGANMTETENYECYPIPEYVPQNGRAEGFYPDSSVAYIRILWKEFEPSRGEYHYEVIEDVLKKARACGQTVMFRLMAHSTRESDDVPDWLKEMIPCPARPEGQRVKASPTAPEFLEYFGQAIQAIGRRFDDDPTLDVMDICLPGSWGEGYNLHLYPEEDLKKLMDIYTTSFPKTNLIGQVIAPDLVQYACETKPVGWRGDGTGEPNHMNVKFPRTNEQLPDVWRSAPVSFEAYWWLCEWERQGWDIDEIIELTLGWHLSTFNAKSFPMPEAWREKIEYWNSRMGYHYNVKSFAYPQEAAPGDTLELKLAIDNFGVAPIYRSHKVWLKVVGNGMAYQIPLALDIRDWYPGVTNCECSVALPADMLPGSYKLELGIGGGEEPVIYLGTDAESDNGSYIVGELAVI